jgi:hypothetical protein
MAGTLVINEGTCWLPAGWVYDSVLEDAGARLAGTSADLAERVLSATTSASIGYLEVGSWTREDLEAFAVAVRQGLDRVVRGGESSFHDPRFFDGYVRKVTELVAMLDAELASRGAVL